MIIITDILNELIIAFRLFFILLDIIIATLTTLLTWRLPITASLPSSPQRQCIVISLNNPVEHIAPLLHVRYVSA